MGFLLLFIVSDSFFKLKKAKQEPPFLGTPVAH